MMTLFEAKKMQISCQKRETSRDKLQFIFFTFISVIQNHIQTPVLPIHIMTVTSETGFVSHFDDISLHCALSLAAQCTVIGPVCGFVCVCLWVCYHDNLKLRASIFTKLGLYVKVVTISS